MYHSKLVDRFAVGDHYLFGKANSLHVILNEVKDLDTPEAQ
jgi:hypothetical protein